MVVLDDSQCLLWRCQIEQDKLAKMVTKKSIVWPRRMDINSAYRISLKLFASFNEDGVRLSKLCRLIVTVEHVKFSVRSANQDEVVAHSYARWLAIIELSLDRQLRADLFQKDLLGEPVLQNWLGCQTLPGDLRVLVQVLLSVRLMPPFIPIDEPDHVD